MNTTASAPVQYSLRSGEIHVWTTILPSTRSGLANLPDILSAAERSRAARFAVEKDQARFVSCRTSLRLLLSRYTTIPPESILFLKGAQGKPALAQSPDWQFNVSHSHDLAAIAISRSAPIGIDLEFIDPSFPCGEVAPEVFSPGELRDLAAIPSAGRTQHFFQLWTLKEALLKATGHGFSQDPRQIRIRLRQTLPPAVVSAPPGFTPSTIRTLTLHPAFAAAVALLAPVSDLSLFTL